MDKSKLRLGSSRKAAGTVLLMSGGCFLNKGMQGRDGDPLSYKTATAVTCVAILPSTGTSGFVQVN